MIAAWSVFALAAGFCLLVYAGYPLLIAGLARWRPRPVRRAPIRPPLSLIVAAHNEEAVIGAKVADALAQDYPADRLEVIVVSDGSSDRTAAIVAAVQDRRVRLVERPREGKLPALAAGVEAASGEIVAFSDANTELAPAALAALVEPFADPQVGGVCGEKRYRAGDGDATGTGEASYWSFDTWLKRQESRAGSVFAADGALYAVRRSLFVAPADPAQADDIAISARVVLQGRRLVAEPGAVAFERAPVEGREEFARKVRITNHSVRALLGLGPALWRSGLYSVELLGHKLLRHLVPCFLPPLFAANVVLAGRWPAMAVPLVAQAALYGLGLAGWLLRRTRLGRARILALPYFFCLANAAALVGVLSILGGRRLAAWTPRTGAGAADPPAAAAGSSDTPSPKRGTHSMTRTLMIVLANLLLAAGAAAAQAPADDPGADAVEWEVGLGAAAFDNFFQAPDGAPQDDVQAGLVRLGGDARLGSARQFRLGGRLEHLEYSDDLDRSDRAALAFRHTGVPHQWEVTATADRDRPAFDVGDEFDRMDGERLGATYAYRVARVLDVGATGEVGRQRFELRDSKDSDLSELGGFLRYRGFGSAFSPEVGYLTGERDVEDPNEDYDEDTLYVQLRFAPAREWYVSLRYRDRDREYTTADLLGSNFGREDDRRDWTLSVVGRFARRFGWGLYGNFLDADSTKATRVFETTTLSSWLSYFF